MSIKCKFGMHSYMKIGKKSFTPPTNRAFQNVFEDQARKFLFGFTTVVGECKCGKRKLFEYTGDQREIL